MNWTYFQCNPKTKRTGEWGAGRRNGPGWRRRQRGGWIAPKGTKWTTEYQANLRNLMHYLSNVLMWSSVLTDWRMIWLDVNMCSGAMAMRAIGVHERRDCTQVCVIGGVMTTEARWGEMLPCDWRRDSATPERITKRCRDKGQAWVLRPNEK